MPQLSATCVRGSTLHRLVQRRAACLVAHTEASAGVALPRFVKDEFDAFLEYDIVAHGFLKLPAPSAPCARASLGVVTLAVD